MAMDRRTLRGEAGTFLRQYGRPKGRNGMDPNDRRYSRKMEQALKRLPPAELDDLLRGEGDDEAP